MALPTNSDGAVAVFLLACLLFLSTPPVQSSSPSIIAVLSDLQSSSSSGVIRLNDNLLRRIHSLPTPRPFHFIVFFDAKKLHSRSELALTSLRSEFAAVSASFLANNPDNRSRSQLFFFDAEVDESQASFNFFSVNSLPHIRLIPSTAADVKSNSIKLDPAHFSTLINSLPEFITSETSVSLGPISRPPLLSKSQMAAVAAAAAISAPYAVRKVATGKSVLHKKRVWMVGSICVYFFSVSGAMFNIIRKAPMFVVDRRDGERVMFFYRGSGVQLGVEGFTVGFLYTVVGVMLAFVCHWLVLVKSRKRQRLCMVVVLLASFWAVRKVIFLNNWKTGYHIHAFWPSISSYD